MNDEKFELTISDLAGSGTYYADIADELRARDTAQREALARVEAERDSAHITIDLWKEQYDSAVRYGNELLAERDAAQGQLAEMRRIVAGFLFNYDDGVGKPWERRLLDYARKLVDAKEFNAQAEQQEAGHGHVTPRADGVVMKCGGPGLCAVCTAEQEAKGAQAGEFQREDLYIVIKRKDLDRLPMEMRLPFSMALNELAPRLPKRECLVIESDWPEYEPTWAAIQARMTGQGAQAGDEYFASPEEYAAQRAALATQPAALPTDPASWPLKVGADEFVSQQAEWPDTDPSDFMHDALYEMIRVLTQPDVRGAEHE